MLLKSLHDFSEGDPEYYYYYREGNDIFEEE